MSGYNLNNNNVIPFTPGKNGVKMDFGKVLGDNDNHTWIVTFNAGVGFTSEPHVFLSINAPNNQISYTVNLNSVSTSGFTISKYFNGSNRATSETVWWFAIGT